MSEDVKFEATQEDCHMVWRQDFDYGGQDYYNKISKYHVRAVKTIKS